MNTASKIILDRLDASLKLQGVTLKRSQLLETAATAFGYHNSGEYSAAAKRGDLTPRSSAVNGRGRIGDEALIVLRDVEANIPYAVDETFLEQVVDDERREQFGPSPYGGLVDLRDIVRQRGGARQRSGVVARGMGCNTRRGARVVERVVGVISCHGCGPGWPPPRPPAPLQSYTVPRPARRPVVLMGS